MEEPASPKNSPYMMELEPGNYAWCSCGRAANQPFCDGSHRGSEFLPVVQKFEEKTTVAWCGCKKTAGAPFCDGSHSAKEES